MLANALAANRESSRSRGRPTRFAMHLGAAVVDWLGSAPKRRSRLADRLREMVRGARTIFVVYPDPDREIVDRCFYTPVHDTDEALAMAWFETGRYLESAMDVEISRVAVERRRQHDRSSRAG